eukprot:1571850-Rhodomonas_salina.1
MPEKFFRTSKLGMRVSNTTFHYGYAILAWCLSWGPWLSRCLPRYIQASVPVTHRVQLLEPRHRDSMLYYGKPAPPLEGHTGFSHTSTRSASRLD